MSKLLNAICGSSDHTMQSEDGADGTKHIHVPVRGYNIDRYPSSRHWSYRAGTVVSHPLPTSVGSKYIWLAIQNTH